MGCTTTKAVKIDAQRENSILAADIAAEAAASMVHSLEGGDNLMVLPKQQAPQRAGSRTARSNGGLLLHAATGSASFSSSHKSGGGGEARKLSNPASSDGDDATHVKPAPSFEGPGPVDRSLTGGSTLSVMPEGRPSRRQMSRSHFSKSSRSIELESFTESLCEPSGRLQTISSKKSRVKRMSDGGQASATGTVAWKRGDLIGAGASGRVFMALNDNTGQLMAVKEMMCTDDLSEDDLFAIKNEIELMRTLRHPNVVEYLGTDVVDNSLLIFTEWVPGGSLLALQKKFGKLSETIIKNYTRQILLGLDYLHQNQVVHRDIKAANILVDDRGTIKLADFGSSKRISESGMLQARSLKGTPYFMAPEVIAQQNHGPKADIWAMGCTIIHMVSGEHPWQSMNLGTPHAIMYHIVNSTEPPPLPNGISHVLRDFLLACFKRNVNERPTAEELLTHPFLKESTSEVAAAVTYEQFLVPEPSQSDPFAGSKARDSSDPSVPSLGTAASQESESDTSPDKYAPPPVRSNLPPARRRRRAHSKTQSQHHALVGCPLEETKENSESYRENSSRQRSGRSGSRHRSNSKREGGNSETMAAVSRQQSSSRIQQQEEMASVRTAGTNSSTRKDEDSRRLSTSRGTARDNKSTRGGEGTQHRSGENRTREGRKGSRRRPRSRPARQATAEGGGKQRSGLPPPIQRPGTFRSVNEYLQDRAASQERRRQTTLQPGGAAAGPPHQGLDGFGDSLDNQTSEWVSVEASPFDLQVGVTSGRFEALDSSSSFHDPPSFPNHFPPGSGQNSVQGSPLTDRKASPGSVTYRSNREAYGYLPSTSELRPSQEMLGEYEGYNNSLGLGNVDPRASSERNSLSRMPSAHSTILERMSSVHSSHENRPIITAQSMREKQAMQEAYQHKQQHHRRKEQEKAMWEEELKKELKYQQQQQQQQTNKVAARPSPTPKRT